MMVPFTNDPVVMHNDRSHKGICFGHSQTLSRQLKAPAHIYFIPLGNQRSSFIANFD